MANPHKKSRVLEKEQVETVLPLGPLQQGMLFHYLMKERVDNYFQQLCYSIKGELNVENLEKAWNAVIQHNEVLRTIYRYEQLKNPVQIILKAEPVQIKYHDLTDIFVEEQERALNRLKKADRDLGIDLENGPTMRVMLCKLNPLEYEMIWSHHHIMLDGWCLGIIFKELFIAYLAMQQGNPIHYPHKARYRDYLKWVQDQKEEGSLLYWQEYLKGFESPSQLPLDYQKERAVESAEILRIAFSVEESRRIEAFAKEHKLTINVLIQVIWGVILQRYNRTNDVVFGATVSGRPAHLPGVEEIVGLFINTLPVRIKTKTSDSILYLLTKVNQANIVRENHEYLTLPAIKGVSELHNHDKLFESIVVYENYPIDRALTDLELGFTITGKSAFEMTNYDLTILGLQTEQLMIEFIYNTDVFHRETIQRLGGQFEYLFAQVLENPDCLVTDLDLITPEETDQVIKLFNATSTDYPVNKTIQELFEEQVQRRSECVAVRYGEVTISYGELNRRANELAYLLRNQGVQADGLVGLMVERSLEMVIGILGILKAGGAYVPLDPAYPSDRLSYMLADTQSSILLTKNSLIEEIPETYQGEIILLDDLSKLVGTASAKQSINPRVVNTPENLAYVMYTSGSTGRPKGVMVRQKSVVRLVKNTNYVALDESERILQAAPYSFDAATFEIWGALLNGGELCLVNPDVVLSMTDLATEIQKQEITTLWLTASLFNRMIDEVCSGLVGLRNLLAGGEALSVSHVTKAIEILPQTRVINGYGPTENTTFTCCHWIREIPKGQKSVPIGIPITNTRVYIVNEWNKPVPIGFPGELCIAGDGLARGYLGQPELTTEKFVPNPFEANTLMYRSGDLARWLADGTIEFLGRLDDQVKIRGYRIEPREIEAVLLKHCEITQAAVIAKKEANKQIYLLAYVESQSRLTSSELRNYLTGRLPDYMIPSVFLNLPKLPLNPNGKVDRQALPENRDKLQTDVDYIAPTNEAEAQLVKVWSEVLGVQKVGVRDNFFDLGGDSIKAIQIVSRLSKEGLYAKVKDIFTQQTIEKVALQLTDGQLPVADQGLIVGEVELNPMQSWFFAQDFADANYWNQSMLLKVNEKIDQELLTSAFRVLIKHHDGLRLNYLQEKNCLVYQRYDLEEIFDLDVYDLSALKPYEQAEQMIQLGTVLKSEFDLTADLLIKVALLYLGENDTRLLITCHHLIIDGVSWRILLEDLEELYRQLKSSQPRLPLKTTSQREWLAKLREYSNSPDLLSEVSYWQRILAQLESIPTNWEQGLDVYGHTASYSVELTIEETAALLTTVHKAYNTDMNDLLLTGLAISLCNWLDRDFVVIRLEGHGREEIIQDVDLSRTIGWFTSMYPVSLAIERNASLADQIKTVKENLHSIPHKGVGYGILKYVTQVPLLQVDTGLEGVSFNYLGEFTDKLGGSLFSMAVERTGPETSQKNRQLAMLDFTGMVINDRLQLSLAYSSKRYAKETIREVLDQYLNSLRKIIEHCDTTTGCYTPSDFPLAQLSQEYLEKLDKSQIEDIYGLSPMQGGMLYQYILKPEALNYLEQFSFRITGTIDVDDFTKAWNRVIERHAALRTIFIWKDVTEPVQMVLPKLPIEITLQDLRMYEEKEQEAQLLKIKKTDRKKQLALETGPNMRLLLLFLKDGESELIWTFHHILLDGWCLGIIFKELFTIYLHLQKDIPLSLNSPYPYKDYIHWLKMQDSGTARDYWREYLKDFYEPTLLPLDRPKHGLVAKVGREILSLTVKETAGLEDLAKELKVTVNTLLQTAWGLLLQKYTNTDDIVFGATVSGRPAEVRGVEEMVGLFINTLPVRVLSDSKLSLAELAQKIHTDAVQRKEFEYLPLGAIMEAVGWNSATSLFETMIAFENYPLDETMRQLEAGFQVSNAESYELTNFDLTLIATLGRELNIEFLYNAAIFEKATISRMIRHLQKILEQIRQRPDLAISKLSLLSSTNITEEEDQILNLFNNTASDYPKEYSIQQVFEEQVERYSNRVAVVDQKTVVSYKELNLSVNRLANWLLEKSFESETLIALIFSPSVEMIVATLGILKAGCAYVPLDPTYPPERIRFMLEDTGTPLILTDQIFCEMIPADYSGEVWVMDLESSQLSLYVSGKSIIHQKLSELTSWNPSPRSGSDDLAYVMYTSGSTGIPKGVMVRQRSVIRLVKNTNYIQLDEAHRLLQAAPYSFDAATFEIWGALLCGGELHLIAKEQILSMTELARVVWEKDITTLWLTASLFNRMIDEAPEGLQKVRNLLVGGEALSVSHVRKALAILPNTRLINGYGPTENTTFTCCYHIEKNVDNQQSIPIGKPIANTRVYVLDGDLNLLPIGVPGELCIAGDGLASGYLNSPELTATKFITHPLFPGEKLYRSGDLVRWRLDGNIEFLGRIDKQVKIRGFRIELREIENVLLSHPGIQQAVVLPRIDAKGDKYLAAYVEAREKFTVNDLRRFLLQTLPEYMVPNAFVQMDQFPLSPNGKVDLRFLPEPTYQMEIGTDYVPPTTPTEKALVEVWSEVLNVDLIGIDDDFFDLGGHSLKLIQIMSKVNQLTAKEHPLALFYENPTIRQLAKALETRDSRDRSNLVLLRPGDTMKNLFGIHPGDGIIDYYIPLALNLDHSYNIYGLHARGLGDLSEALPTSVEEMAADYITEIKKVQTAGPYNFIGWCIGGAIGFEMVRQLKTQGEEIGLFIIMDARALHAEDLDPDQTVRQDFIYVLEKMGVPRTTLDDLSLEGIIDYAYDQEIASTHEVLKSVSKVNFKRQTQVRKNLIHICNLYNPVGQLDDNLYYIKAEETDVPYVDWQSWQQWFNGEVHQWITPGDHMSMFEIPNVLNVSRIVNDLLKEKEMRV